jgi:preprotein translocase subunit YajC
VSGRPSGLFGRSIVEKGPRKVLSLSFLPGLFVVFAQGDEAQPPPGGSLFSTLFPLIVIGFLFYLILLRPERRKQKEHASLLSNLKKNDKVVTIGGIYGKVFDVQREQDRVTLKIDEATNTKIEVTFGAIARVIMEDTTEKDK